MSKWSVKGCIRQLQIRRIRAQACSWLFELSEAPTKIHSEEFIRWLNASPIHTEQYLLEKKADKEVDGYLEELLGVIDVDASAESARKEIRAERLRWRIFCVAAGTVGLIAACLSLTAIS